MISGGVPDTYGGSAVALRDQPGRGRQPEWFAPAYVADNTAEYIALYGTSGMAVSIEIEGRVQLPVGTHGCCINSRGNRLAEGGIQPEDRRYGNDYVPAEERARAAGRGIRKSEFIAPWVWRKSDG